MEVPWKGVSDRVERGRLQISFILANLSTLYGSSFTARDLGYEFVGATRERDGHTSLTGIESIQSLLNANTAVEALRDPEDREAREIARQSILADLPNWGGVVAGVLTQGVEEGRAEVRANVVGRPDVSVRLAADQISRGSLDLVHNSLAVPVAPGVTEVYTNLLVTPRGEKASSPPKKLTPDVAAETLREVIKKTGSYSVIQEGRFEVLLTNLVKGDVWPLFKAECEKRGFDPGKQGTFEDKVGEVPPGSTRSDRGTWNGDGKNWKIRWIAGGKDKNRSRRTTPEIC